MLAWLVAIMERKCTRVCARWVTAEPMMLVYMFASFLTYPTFQQLLYTSVCSSLNCTHSIDDNGNNGTTASCDMNSSNSSPVEDKVRTKVSHWILYNNLAASIPAIIAALFYGSFSDRYGRRIFMVLPALGGAANALIVLVVSYLAPHRIQLYLIGSFILGATGGFSIFNFAVYSYMADISTLGNRTTKLSILESMTYFGATISSFLSGIWIKREGFVPPFWGIFTCYTLVALYAAFLLPRVTTVEDTPSVSTNARVVLSSDSSPVTTIGTNASSYDCNILLDILRRIGKFFTVLCSSWRIFLLCLIFFFVEVNFLGITDIVILYCINRLCWSSEWIGYFLGSKVFFNGVAALLILPVLTIVLKVSDTAAVLIGLVSSIGALVAMGTATHTWTMLLAPVIGAMRGCVVPIVRSMLSKLTPPTYQGVMFSGVSVIEGSSMLIASAMYNALFPATYSITPGFCFYLMILLLFVPISCTIVLHLNKQHSMKKMKDGSSQSLIQ